MTTWLTRQENLNRFGLYLCWVVPGYEDSIPELDDKKDSDGEEEEEEEKEKDDKNT
jgi:hypothetical protein